MTQRADTFGNDIHGQSQFVVMRFKHQMQRLKHRSRDIPMKIVRFEIQRVRIG
jgi:hypothetical protein